MTRASVASPSLSIPSPPLASILGVDNTLCVRRHVSSSRPHIVLKRVVDSTHEADDVHSRVLYFKFFTTKRIAMKAGKEILFAVETNVEEFDGKALMLQTTVFPEHSSASEETEKDVPTEGADEDHSVLPPKLRRMLEESLEEQTSPHRPVGVEDAITGVQPTASTCDAAVQVAPATSAKSTQSPTFWADEVAQSQSS
ncbi:hypothetical protein EV121DRAFT_297525 [Schizophyllum commune]